MINDDPLLSRIREIRRQISAQCDHDPAKLVAHYMELDQTYPKERFFKQLAPSTPLVKEGTYSQPGNY
ncbi:MAG: hypothetical protein BWK78_04035 [Thiotrichaceae bacterium IS1]|nr:MAG: hypothetical protein BWK78_04035 [Thiotrichaceae bacterium IS1]